MKRKETKKLFYKTYLYKIDIIGNYTRLFSKWNNPSRNYSNIFEYAKTLKNEVKSKRSVKVQSKLYWRTKEFELTKSEVHAFYKVAKSLSKTQDKIRTRQEYYTLSIYTNDYNLIEELSNDKDINCLTLWEPNTDAVDLLLKNQEIIIVKSPPEYEYKLTIRNYDKNEAVVNWIIANSNKVKITDYSLHVLTEGYYAGALTVYLRDSKVLTLAQMLMGKHIKRVEKLVCVEEN